MCAFHREKVRFAEASAENSKLSDQKEDIVEGDVCPDCGHEYAEVTESVGKKIVGCKNCTFAGQKSF